MQPTFTPTPPPSHLRALVTAYVVALPTLIAAGSAGLGGPLSTLLALGVGAFTWATFAPPVRK